MFTQGANGTLVQSREEFTSSLQDRAARTQRIAQLCASGQDFSLVPFLAPAGH